VIKSIKSFDKPGFLAGRQTAQIVQTSEKQDRAEKQNFRLFGLPRDGRNRQYPIFHAD